MSTRCGAASSPEVSMTITRRNVLSSTLAAGAALAGRKAMAQPAGSPTPPSVPAGPKTGRRSPLVVPNGSVLPWRVRDGIKIYHLRAMPVRHTIAPGLEIEAWGYNGSTPGPVLEAVEGDRVRIYVTNTLPEA